MNSPSISVLIDTYNYGQFIEQAVQSVLEQDFPEEQFEVLVIDDGSTDDTAKRLEKFAKRIRYFQKENGGQASAFNFGIAQARGEIVMFLDADDFWLPGKMLRISENFDNNPSVGMVHHPLLQVDSASGAGQKTAFEPISGDLTKNISNLLRFCPTPTSSLSFRKWVLEKIVPIPDPITLQADGYLQAIAPLIAPIIGIDECLAVYRIHGSNLYHFKREGQKGIVERRARTLRHLVNGARDWCLRNGYSQSDRAVRSTLARWSTIYEREKFTVEPPGRIEYFAHAWRTNNNQLPLMTWKLVLLNYSSALGALIFGYSHRNFIEKYGHAVMDKLQRLPSFAGKVVDLAKNVKRK